MKTTKEFLEIYKNWKTKRDKEMDDKIANLDPVIRTEPKTLSRAEWRSEYKETYYIDRNYKGYLEQRIF